MNTLEWYRCPGARCGRKLARLRLSGSSVVEVKCPYCNAVSVQEGMNTPRLVELATAT